MSNFVIALLVSISVFAWSYNKFISRTGGNTQRALTTATMLSGMTLLVSLVLLSLIA